MSWQQFYDEFCTVFMLGSLGLGHTAYTEMQNHANCAAPHWFGVASPAVAAMHELRNFNKAKAL